MPDATPPTTIADVPTLVAIIVAATRIQDRVLARFARDRLAELGIHVSLSRDFPFRFPPPSQNPALVPEAVR